MSDATNNARTLMRIPFPPREWQKQMLIKVAALALKKPNFRALVVASCGSGKTRAYYMIAAAIGTRFLFLVHLDTLVNQVEKEVRELFPEMRVGVLKAARNDGVASDFCIASIQSLANPARLAELVASETTHGFWDLIGCDEAHHAGPGSTYQRVIAAFPDRPCIGMTATPVRMDRKDLAEVWTDGIIYRYKIPDAQRDGVNVYVEDGRGGPQNKAHRLIVPGIDARAAAAAERAGDKDAARKALGDVAWPAVSREVAFLTEELGRKVIIFTPDVESAHLVAEYSVQLGVKATAVDGKISKREVKNRLAALRSGEIRAAASCMILAEGYDDPSVDGVVFARSTFSEGLYVQAVGRGLRAHPGKESCVISDLVGAHEVHGLVTSETLFNGPDEAAEAPATETIAPLTDEAKEPDDRKSAMWRSFLALLSGSRTLESFARSGKVAWLPVSKDSTSYAIGGADGATYVIERGEGGLWRALREPRGRGLPATQLTARVTLEAAQKAAEVASRAGESFDARDAGWREEEAGARVRAALLKWRVPVPDKVSAGEASDALVIAAARARNRDRARRGIVIGGGCAFD